MNLEIDVYVPHKKIGIEINGMFWHSTLVDPNPFKHQTKALIALYKGIRLLQFWEYQLRDPHYWSICKSIIRHSLGKSIKLYARECCVQEINNQTYRDFVIKNHLQGYSAAKIRLGLIHKNYGLVSVISFAESRSDKCYQWEIVRYATKLNYYVIGGFSKMLRYFISCYKPKTIVAYADLLHGYGAAYEKAGFEFVDITKPNYFYFRQPNEIVTHFQTQKQNLNDLLDNFDPSLSEEENMLRNGYFKIWDAGGVKWLLTL